MPKLLPDIAINIEFWKWIDKNFWHNFSHSFIQYIYFNWIEQYSRWVQCWKSRLKWCVGMDGTDDRKALWSEYLYILIHNIQIYAMLPSSQVLNEMYCTEMYAKSASVSMALMWHLLFHLLGGFHSRAAKAKVAKIANSLTTWRKNHTRTLFRSCWNFIYVHTEKLNLHTHISLY